MIKINGKNLNISGQCLLDYLKSASINPMRVAVERNGKILPKDSYADTILEDGDSLEIVSFVGGG